MVVAVTVPIGQACSLPKDTGYHLLDVRVGLQTQAVVHAQSLLAAEQVVHEVDELDQLWVLLLQTASLVGVRRVAELLMQHRVADNVEARNQRFVLVLRVIWCLADIVGLLFVFFFILLLFIRIPDIVESASAIEQSTQLLVDGLRHLQLGHVVCEVVGVFTSPSVLLELLAGLEILQGIHKFVGHCVQSSHALAVEVELRHQVQLAL